MCFNYPASENKNTLSSAFLCCCSGRLSNVSNMLDHFLLWPQSSFFWQCHEDPCLVLTLVLVEAETPSTVSLSILFSINVLSECWNQSKFRLENERVLYYYRSLLLVDSWVLCILRRNQLAPTLGEISVSLQNVPVRPSISQESLWKNFVGLILILFIYIVTLYISSDIKKVSNNV